MGAMTIVLTCYFSARTATTRYIMATHGCRRPLWMGNSPGRERGFETRWVRKDWGSAPHLSAIFNGEVTEPGLRYSPGKRAVPQGARRSESCPLRQFCPHRLVVATEPSHGSNPGSIPGGGTTLGGWRNGRRRGLKTLRPFTGSCESDSRTSHQSHAVVVELADTAGPNPAAPSGRMGVRVPPPAPSWSCSSAVRAGDS